MMLKRVMTALGISFVLAGSVALSSGEPESPFSPHVDAKGNISFPSGIRSEGVHLGTWIVTSTAAAGPAPAETSPGTGIHTVYTRPDALNAHAKTGKWPDGAMLIMEVRRIQWDDLPTGHVMTGGEPVRWLVMIRDAKGRFPGNPHWGDGWGWALFKPDDPGKNVSSNYSNDCRGCHETAKDTEWVFTRGYPAVRGRN